jgi:hypothetical protein
MVQIILPISICSIYVRPCKFVKICKIECYCCEIVLALYQDFLIMVCTVNSFDYDKTMKTIIVLVVLMLIIMIVLAKEKANKQSDDDECRRRERECRCGVWNDRWDDIGGGRRCRRCRDCNDDECRRREGMCRCGVWDDRWDDIGGGRRCRRCRDCPP